MALSSKLLGADEHVVRHMRTHGKALVWPAIALVLILAAMTAALVYLPDRVSGWGRWVVLAVAAAAIVAFFVLPLLRWMTTTYTITNRRIITRRGLLNRTGHDLPLSRINNVAYDRGVLDRLLGCGSLTLTTAAETPVVLHDIPDVERVHVAMTELLFGDGAGAATEQLD